MIEFNYDIIIIGGGPGGSSSAIYLSQKGYNVAVFEKEVFPRDHVGESLIPFTFYKMQELGIFEEVMQFATKKPGVNFIDIDGKRQSVWCFNRILSGGAEMSIHTLRAPFDHALLKRAVATGASVFEGATVRSADLSDPESAAVKVTLRDGTEQTVRARFLIDASGQHSFLASTMNSRKPYPGLDRVALFSHWINTKYDASLNGGLIKIIYLGGEKLGWLWVIPVGRNHLSIGVTLNNSYVREQKKILGPNWKELLYRQEVGFAENLKSILAEADIEHDVQVIGDYSFSVEKKFGSNYVHVGDSGAFLDPIFSSGIYIAMEVAERASRCIDLQLREGAERGQELFRTEFTKIEGAYRLVEKFVRLFYQPDVLNFSHAGVSENGFQSFVNAYEAFHYLLAGDFFSEYKKYEEFLDQLNNEKQFNQFVHFVKSQAKEYPNEDYCRYSFEEIYGHLPDSDRVAPGMLGKS